MRLEYFEMIDRVTCPRPRRRSGSRRARSCPMESPVFEGHFPGHPLVPGVLLTETMAQASGYLVLGLMDFTHMPFLMAVDKARFRTFVGPRYGARRHGAAGARGLGLRGDQGARSRSTASRSATPSCASGSCPSRTGMDGADARAGAPDRASRGGRLMREVVITGVGLVSSVGRGRRSASRGARERRRAARSTRRPSRPTRSTRRCRSTTTGRSRRSPTSARWSPGRGSACYAAGPRARRGAARRTTRP